jgi:hypothetical protein
MQPWTRFLYLQRLGGEALSRLERQLTTYGKANVLELLQVQPCCPLAYLAC